MTTFDLATVRGFAADLDDRMYRCDNGEGTECDTLDNVLKYYANLCCEFREAVRQWGRAVFCGKVAFDPEAERIWQDEGHRLYMRALAIQGYGRRAEVACYVLDGQTVLQSAIRDLEHLLKGWVTPKLAVGPAARRGVPLTPEAAQEARRRIESLPPLSADWQPIDPHQQNQLRRLRKRPTS